MKIETRDLALPVEIREAAPGQGAGKLAGYAAKFGVESCPLFDPFGAGRFVEVIRAGAFARSLRESPDIRALFNHDSGVVLGRTKPRTLRLWEDQAGLAFELDLPDTQAARDARESVKRGDIDGMSFGFVVVEDDVEKRADGTALRTLIDVDLVEISLVAFPAYQDTDVAARARKGHPGRPRLELIRRKLRALDL